MTWNNFPQLGKLWNLHLICYTSSQFVSKSTSVLPRTFFTASVASAKASGQIIGEIAQKLEWWRLVTVGVEGRRQWWGQWRERARSVTVAAHTFLTFWFIKGRHFPLTFQVTWSPPHPHLSPVSTPCSLPRRKCSKTPATVGFRKERVNQYATQDLER